MTRPARTHGHATRGGTSTADMLWQTASWALVWAGLFLAIGAIGAMLGR